jgi:hypothetical protein
VGFRAGPGVGFGLGLFELITGEEDRVDGRLIGAVYFTSNVPHETSLT